MTGSGTGTGTWLELETLGITSATGKGTGFPIYSRVAPGEWYVVHPGWGEPVPNEKAARLESKAISRANRLPNLKFRSPDIRTGLNVTVRLGMKHHNPYSACVMLSDVSSSGGESNGAYIGPAEIVRTRLCFFKDITLNDLALEHNERAQTPYGLQKILSEVYGRDILYKDVVTVVTFIPKYWGVLLPEEPI